MLLLLFCLVFDRVSCIAQVGPQITVSEAGLALPITLPLLPGSEITGMHHNGQHVNEMASDSSPKLRLPGHSDLCAKHCQGEMDQSLLERPWLWSRAST